ncbi:MAG TPA: S8 family serine peptidase, partial [Pyrinomonadaceae bacterium]
MSYNVRKTVAVALSLVLGASHAYAGLIIRGGDGLVMTGADGIQYEDTNGLVMTGADESLIGVNGITVTRTSGVALRWEDGLVMTGADGVTYRAERADSVSINHLNGLVMTGADGLVMTGADGTQYQAVSVRIRQADGLVMTGADGLVMTGADGLRKAEENGLVMTGADGLVMTGADTVRLVRAAEVTATGPDGSVYSVSGDGLVMTGADGLVMTGADGVAMREVQGLVMTGADGFLMASVGGATGVGLQSVDPELAALLEQSTNDEHINAAIIYHSAVTESDLATLRGIGVTGGTRFRVLPVVLVTATPTQLAAVSSLPTVRALYGNRTLQWTADTSRETTGLKRARADADLTQRFSNVPVSGAGVTVAVIDTGIDATHHDLAGRVARNVKLADLQGLPSLDFSYPVNLEGLQNTDQAYGHGTHVASVVAGEGKRSGGRYAGYAPGARLVGLSAGEANLFFVLGGFDYILQNRAALGIRVVNCSFSANTLFDLDDPVNVATKMLTDAGVNVVFSAGNTGPGHGSLNPYAAAPWVISVGSTDARGRPSKFSSRGEFASGMFRPSVVAPGEAVVGARASGVNVTGAAGVVGDTGLTNGEQKYYTTASGTSFSAPQVAGAIALMLQANPNLRPSDVRAILRRTSTPLQPFLSHEVGSGMLNTHAAVLEAAFPARYISEYRGSLDRGQVAFYKDAPQEFAGAAMPGQWTEVGLTIPDGALLASVQIAWGPFQSANDLALYMDDPAQTTRGSSNGINLPGLTGKRERAVLTKPQPGQWNARVAHTVGLAATLQDFSGTLEIGRVDYAPLADTSAYAGTAAYDDIRQALRHFVMLPDGDLFRPDAAATRADAAAALLMGARVPLYVAAQPMFTDVTDPWLRSYVESAHMAPAGAIFPNVSAGGVFNPSGQLERLTAAVALVRAAGLEAEAQASAGEPLAYTDAAQIPLP